MNKFDCEAGENTPQIKGSITDGKISVIGRSFPDNAFHFYDPFYKWLNSFLDEAPDKVQLTFDLEYFNTGSSSIIFNVVNMFKKFLTTQNLVIFWVFESDDTDIKEVGLQLQDLFGDIIVLYEKPSQE